MLNNKPTLRIKKIHLERIIYMEIEKKFLIDQSMIQLETYPFVTIEQGYICTDPVIRIRKKRQALLHYL